MRAEVLEYYKKSLYRGRSKIGRAIDFMFMRLLLFCALYLFFLSSVRDSAAIVLALAGLALLSALIEAIKRRVLARHISHQRAKLRREYQQIDMLTSSSDALLECCKRALPNTDWHLYVHQSLREVNEDCLLSAYRAAKDAGKSKIAVFTVAALTKEAVAIERALGECTFRFYLSEEFIALALDCGLVTQIDDAEVDARLLASLAKDKKGTRFTRIKPFLRSRAMGYVVLAGVLFLLSFIMRYALYYRMMALLCMSFAAISTIVNRLPATDT
ncbi:MAG: hypothetical protein Q4B99_03350 [Clostridia bacterium]|nr:hypothetical protein [Clostridia bacterium]